MDKTSNNLDAYWMPFTANRQFKASPRILTEAKGMYYKTQDGRQVLDATAGLWCCNAGHGRDEISAAVSEQIRTLDYSPSFQMGHPKQFELAQRLAALAPEPLNKVFYTNSGSESVETAIKIARAYQHKRGFVHKTHLIGREKGYHGVNFAGISVGGLPNNKAGFGKLLPEVSHLPHTHDLEKNAFSRGLPVHGIEKADALEAMISEYGAEHIAAVIVEPVAGSAGVLIPPQGYLQRLRDITLKHDILLIFDEVITGFGRVSESFAAKKWGVTPDIITCAKGLTNGCAPMGAVIVSDGIHDVFMSGPEAAIEFCHGYTYSGHPIACAAALATLDIYEQDNLFDAAETLSGHWQAALHRLDHYPNVIDVRNIGLMAAIELAPRTEQPGSRGFSIYQHCFDNNVLVRCTADTIALSPPLIIDKHQIDTVVDTIGQALETLAAQEEGSMLAEETV